MKFRIYVDEVGNPDLESSDNPNHRFLSLTGVILELDYVEKTLQPQLERLKADFFHSHPDDPVVLHRKEMLSAKPPFEVLRDPEIRSKFDQRLLAFLDEWDYTVISVCIDKKKHKETYLTWRYEPYHYCLAVLLERFVFFLNRHGSTGDVMAESRGGKEDIRLKNSFHRLWTQGTDFVDSQQIQRVLTSSQLKVKPKSMNVSGLQLTDLLAYPSRNEILSEHGLLGRDLAPFTKAMVQVLGKKYDQRGERCFGKKML